MSIATILPSLDSKISKENWQFRLANDNTTTVEGPAGGPCLSSVSRRLEGDGAPAGWPRPWWWSPTVLRPSRYPRDCFCL